jgi:flavodoxin
MTVARLKAEGDKTLDNGQIVETTEVASAGTDEKFVSQSEVNRIAGRVRAETAEKVRRELEAEHAAKTAQNTGTGSVDTEKVVEEVARRLKADLEKDQEKLLESQQKQAWDSVTREYDSKLRKASQSKEYPDFDEVVRDFEHSSYDFVVWGANQQENTADVVYELAKDPERRIRLEMLGRNDRKGFEKAMKQFADSVKNNKEAAKKASTQSAPLPRLKSNVVTTGAASSDTDDYLALKARYNKVN